MADWRRFAGPGGAAAGVALGYLLERAAFRGRLPVSRYGPELGTLEGEGREIRGPDGTRLFVEVYGPAGSEEPGPPVPEVVLVHGYSMSGRSWHEQVVALRDRFRLVTYDQPGHSRSSAPRSGSYSLALLADALRDVIEAATDPSRGRLIVVGHSMGGMTALAFARCHAELFRERVGALLLLSTTARAEAEDIAMGIGIQALARLQRGFEAVAGLLGSRVRHFAHVYRASSDLSFVLVRAIALSRGADPRYVDLTEQLVLDTDLAAATKLLPVVLAMDEDETLATIDVPTIVVVGLADRLTPAAHARHMARKNSCVELVELPGIGHMTPMEALHTVNALTVRLHDAVTGRTGQVDGSRHAAVAPR